MYIAQVGIAHPPHYYNQEQLLGAFETLWAKKHHNPKRVAQLHKAVRVGGRHLALPMEDYEQLEGFTDANNAFIRVGTDVGENAILNALNGTGLTPKDIDAIFFSFLLRSGLLLLKIWSYFQHSDGKYSQWLKSRFPLHL